MRVWGCVVVGCGRSWRWRAARGGVVVCTYTSGMWRLGGIGVLSAVGFRGPSRVLILTPESPRWELLVWAVCHCCGIGSVTRAPCTCKWAGRKPAASDAPLLQVCICGNVHPHIFKNPNTQTVQGSQIQKSKNSNIQKFKNTRIQKFKNP